MGEMGYATNTLASIPFGQVIGGPMKAAIEAQGLAAMKTVEFIKAVGFKPPKADPFAIDLLPEDSDPDIGDIRNVVFSYSIKRDDGTTALASLSVPILTIIPIPFIRIDEMTIDFMAKINESTQHASTDASSSASSSNYSASWNGWWWGARAGFNASYSSKHSSTSAASSKYQTEFTMNVHVRAVQDDIPAGLSRVLNILETTIKETTPAAPAPVK